MHQNPFSAGAPLRKLTTLPQTPESAGEGDTPSPLNAFGVSNSARASVLRPPSKQNPGYTPV